MKLSERCRRAADYLAEYGHCKNVLRDRRGRVCLAGALGMVSDCSVTYGTPADAEEHADAWQVVYDLADLVPQGFREDTTDYRVTAVQWNNAPETTGEDVILLLKRQAEVYEAMGL